MKDSMAVCVCSLCMSAMYAIRTVKYSVGLYLPIHTISTLMDIMPSAFSGLLQGKLPPDKSLMGR